MKSIKYLFFILLSAYGFSQSNNEILPNSEKKIESPREKRKLKNENIILPTPEKKAEYPGGKRKLKNEIESKIHYPQDAIDNHIQGTVILHFIVEEDGSISNISIYKDIGRQCGAEAMKTLKELNPKWKAATVKNKPVRSWEKISVVFHPSKRRKAKK